MIDSEAATSGNFNISAGTKKMRQLMSNTTYLTKERKIT